MSNRPFIDPLTDSLVGLTEAEARAIFVKWDLDFAIVGETIAEDRFLILHGNEVKADLPLSKLSSSAPEYDRPWVETPVAAPLTDVPVIGAMLIPISPTAAFASPFLPRRIG